MGCASKTFHGLQGSSPSGPSSSVHSSARRGMDTWHCRAPTPPISQRPEETGPRSPLVGIDISSLSLCIHLLRGGREEEEMRKKRKR